MNEINSKFFLAGNATFTVLNTETGNRFTFKIKQAKDKKTHKLIQVWFVSVLVGPDNYSNYKYIGLINENFVFRKTKTDKISDSPSVQAFWWLWLRRANLPSKVKLYHCGKCGRCGRKLTIPDSIQTGFGPSCLAKLIGGNNSNINLENK